MIVYKITNLINSMVYIGATIRPLKIRWNLHKHDIHSAIITSEIRKYGENNFKVEQIYHAKSVEDMYEKEKYYIQKFKSFEPFGYNRQLGGKIGVKKTKESSLRHSESQKKRFARDGAPRLGTTGKLNPRSKPVKCIENGIIYESANLAAKALGINARSMITRVLKGQRKSTSGYTFQYAKELVK